MLIKYNGVNLHVLSYAGPIKKDNISNSYGQFHLRPGMNEVSADDWKKIEADSEVKDMIDEGKIEIISAKEGKAADVIPTLKEKSAKDAIDLVKNTMDLALLQKWSQSEVRAGVLRAIDAQVQELNDAAKKSAPSND